MGLAEKKCAPCEGGVKPLSGKLLKEYLDKYSSEISGWEVARRKRIVKEWKFVDFKSALEFVNKIGEIAEKENHHPDVWFGWGKARVEIMTHAIGGLSENDFILAAKINSIK
jgi:4a-hydroxytetrahydrobiopterin dehydratase